MSDLERAKGGLSGHTLCLVRGEEILMRDERGIAPMMALLAEGKDLTGFSAADRVVGKAAAMLFVKAKKDQGALRRDDLEICRGIFGGERTAVFLSDDDGIYRQPRRNGPMPDGERRPFLQRPREGVPSLTAKTCLHAEHIT